MLTESEDEQYPQFHPVHTLVEVPVLVYHIHHYLGRLLVEVPLSFLSSTSYKGFDVDLKSILMNQIPDVLA